MALAYIAKDSMAGPLVGAIYMRLRRLSVRFDAVVARIGAGLRPVPRCAGACSGVPRVRAPDLLPHRRGWLADLLQHEAAAYGGYDGRLGYLLCDPDMVALLAASPQIGRVLRPLWRMLSTDKLPAVLRPPRRLASLAFGETPARQMPGQPSPQASPCLASQPLRVADPPPGSPIPA